jgi:hypothetical protein
MKIKKLFTGCLSALLLGTAAQAQQKSAHDYLNVPGPINFNKTAWHLGWSSHPSANYYKQEYITAGGNVEKFRKMITIDYLIGPASTKDIVGAKIAELKKQKESNPIVQYQVFENKGEYMIDFLLSANSADGKKVEIVGRNVYRYLLQKDKSGQPAVVLFALSERAYGDDVQKFLSGLKTNLQAAQTAVATFSIPAVTATEK